MGSQRGTDWVRSMTVAGLLACDPGASGPRILVETESSDATADADAGPDARPDARLDASGADAASLPSCPPASLSLPLGCTEPWVCPETWHPVEGGYGCEPDPLPADCPPGSLALPGVGCGPVWECPTGWSRIAGSIGCEPPPLREDCPAGTFATPLGCSEPWGCPAGWVRAPGRVGCEPRALDCGPDAHPTPDGGCAAVQFAACGPERFGPGPWPADTVFVDPEADAAAADGSQARPFASVDAALRSTEAGTLALSRGRHVFEGAFPRGLRLSGACTEETLLVGFVEVGTDDSAELADLTVEGGPGAEHAMRVSGTSTLRRARVRAGDTASIRALQGSALNL